jgi:hypothetical protein
MAWAIYVDVTNRERWCVQKQAQYELWEKAHGPQVAGILRDGMVCVSVVMRLSCICIRGLWDIGDDDEKRIL